MASKREMKKTKEIVNCPIHPTKDGDSFPTSRCPDCRPYQMKQNKPKKIEKMIVRIEDSKIPEKDEWAKGLNTGLDWAIRVLTGDKSAS
jgi:hypothetical protein